MIASEGKWANTQNRVMAILGAVTVSLWPFLEKTGTQVTGVSAGDLVSSKTAAAAIALETEFSPFQHPGGMQSYHFHPTGDHHLNGIDHNDYSFGNSTVDVPFSCGAWICPTEIATNVIMAKYDSAGAKREWRLLIDANGKLSIELYDESVDTTEIGISDTALTIGKWVFVAMSYDGTENDPLCQLYVDAVVANNGATTETGAYVAMENSTAPLTIGCSGVSALPVSEFHGRIALPFITGKALTATEVLNLYEATRGLIGA